MPGVNGDGEPQKELVETGVRDKNGQFVEGHPALPGGGRPQGSMDCMAIWKRKAKAEGIDLETVVGEALLALRKAMNDDGDIAAIRALLDRTCGILEKGLQINVDHPGSVTIGPPLPEDGDLREQARALLEEDEPSST